MQSCGGKKWWYSGVALEITSGEIALVAPAINSIHSSAINSIDSSANAAVVGVTSVLSSLSVTIVSMIPLKSNISIESDKDDGFSHS